ncbi:hypothetical protein DBR42_28930 [Pelomonas sp. HMWF004]|nr:hypothetical protein DBR42_28930 [Pelomonas sp. HMWF004]
MTSDETAFLNCGIPAAGRTLKSGDWVQFGAGLGTSQLVLCVADAVVNGSGLLTLRFEPPLRMPFAAGTAVTIERPVAHFRKPPGRVGWAAYSDRLTQGMSVDLLEAW